MVIDTLDNLEKYVSLNPLFAEVVKFINETDLTKLETGKHPIQGDDLFVNIAVAHGKTEEEATIEAHRQMIDIQIPHEYRGNLWIFSSEGSPGSGIQRG